MGGRERLRQLKASSPVIVVGCSRSGTSLVSGILQGCGVNMGDEQSGNRESKLFQGINRDILDIVGASWRSLGFLPPADALATHYPYMAKMAERALADHLESRGDAAFAGRDWGWKDPRSSLTLPVWGRVFPNARVLHVVRAGRDVAASLRRREDGRNGEGYISGTAVAAQFMEDVRVWAEYLERAALAMQAFPVRSLIRYETLVREPLETVRRALADLRLDAPGDLGAVVGAVRPARAADYSRFGVDLAEVERIENQAFGCLGLPALASR
ncbi:sulfotransferase [Pseudodesulfovibrio sp.]|uniref:sulfotransferase family protein n=1 Tax=Pseudodesulfovibrio sp. TaxID=2035812 RepID=UPI002625F00D|nr:sulfotransferase [Pseudodesulfovibrio sp.]MDD3313312.1 sulfotransferase [Pseudodesulfovibrio sp.]